MRGDQDSGRRPSGVVGEGHATRLLKKYIPARSAKILDFGCGSGMFLGELKKEGCGNLSGFDIMRYDGAAENFSGVDLKIAGSGEALPWADSTFDAVMALEVLEHVENPRFVEREINRVLKPGGIFVVSVPNAFHLANRIFFFLKRDFIRWSNKNDHFNIFTRKIFNKIFLNDFELVETSYFSPTFGQGLDFKMLHWLDKFKKYLPENQYFGNFATYVMRKKF